METLERVRVVLRQNTLRLHRFEVGKDRDLEAIPYEDSRLDSRFQNSDRPADLAEPANDINFSLRTHRRREHSIGDRRDPGNDIAWRQADDKSVGVAENDRVIGGQTER
jgi:hypothetical protein